MQGKEALREILSWIKVSEREINKLSKNKNEYRPVSADLVNAEKLMAYEKIKKVMKKYIKLTKG